MAKKKKYIKKNIKGGSNTKLGRMVLIAGIEKDYGWKRFREMDQLAFVGAFWNNWRQKMKEWGEREPTTTPEEVLATLSSHSVEIPDFVRSFILPET